MPRNESATSWPRSGAERPEITYRRLRRPEDLRAAVLLQMAVWGFGPDDTIPWSQMKVVGENGGVIAGAFHRRRLIGFVFSQPAWDGREPYLYSKMLGVLPAYRGLGIGRRLKRIQAKAARELGYPRIVWTFDPLERGSALLNVGHLGVRCRRYLVDFYGHGGVGGEVGSLHAGLPSDRLLAEWVLGAAGSGQRARRAIPTAPAAPGVMRLLDLDAGGQRPVPARGRLRLPALIAIPPEIQRLKREDPRAAARWQREIRRALSSALRRGGVVTDIVREATTPVRREFYLVTPDRRGTR